MIPTPREEHSVTTLVAMPTRSTPCPEALNAVAREAYHAGAQFMFPNQEPVEACRNEIVNAWLRSDFDDLIMVDDDSVIPDGAIKKLQSVNALFVCGVQPLYMQGQLVASVQDPGYPEVLKPWYDWCAWKRPREPFRIGACGFGCVLLRRPLFDKLKHPWFVYTSPDRDGKHRETEDVYFCKMCTMAGVEMWCHPQVVCGHMKRINLLDFIPRGAVTFVDSDNAKQDQRHDAALSEVA